MTQHCLLRFLCSSPCRHWLYSPIFPIVSLFFPSFSSFLKGLAWEISQYLNSTSSITNLLWKMFEYYKWVGHWSNKANYKGKILWSYFPKDLYTWCPIWRVWLWKFTRKSKENIWVLMSPSSFTVWVSLFPLHIFFSESFLLSFRLLIEIII